MLAAPLIHPLGQPQPKPGGETVESFQELCLWIRFDNMKLGDEGYRPDEPLMSETYPLEENASHRMMSGV